MFLDYHHCLGSNTFIYLFSTYFQNNLLPFSRQQKIRVATKYKQLKVAIIRLIHEWYCSGNKIQFENRNCFFSVKFQQLLRYSSWVVSVKMCNTEIQRGLIRKLPVVYPVLLRKNICDKFILELFLFHLILHRQYNDSCTITLGRFRAFN